MTRSGKRYAGAIVIVAAIGGVTFLVGGPEFGSAVRAKKGVEKGAEQAARCVTPDRTEVQIPAGEFQMGSDTHYPEEGPVRIVRVDAFSIDKFPVTNAQFRDFVTATGYVTDAEKKPDPADYPEVPPDKLEAGGATFMPLNGRPSPAEMMEWWHFVPGADWRHPDGPGSTIEGKDNEPVVQVSFKDAAAYAAWAGRELPTEAQMEYAARGGLDGKTFAWGDEFKPAGIAQANTWEGEFPVENSAADGFDRAAPVGCFPANGYGLYDVTGNVWQWTTSHYDPSQGRVPPSRVLRVIKGGSFLCAENFCRRYRPAARQSQESGFSTVHLGFRTVKNASSPETKP